VTVVIVGRDGFLAMGGKDVAGPFGAIKHSTQEGKVYRTMDAPKDELKARPGGHQDQDGEVKGSGRSRSWLRPRVGCHRLRDLRTDRADNSGIDIGSIVAVRGGTTKRFCRASAAVRMSTMIAATWLRADFRLSFWRGLAFRWRSASADVADCVRPPAA
jgi:hypothetical protein